MKLVVFSMVTLLNSAVIAELASGDVAQILQRGAAVKQAESKPIRDELEKQMSTMSADIQDQMQLINGLRIAERQPRIVREQEMARLRRRLAILEKLDAYVDSTEAERKQLLKAADERLGEMQAEQRKAGQPANQKLRELYKKYATEHAELADAMKPFFVEQGTDGLAGLKLNSVISQFHECVTYAYYHDKEGEPSLQVSVACGIDDRFRGPTSEKLGDDVVLLRLTDRYATVRAGALQVHLASMKEEGWNQGRIKLAITSLVDLDGLSKIAIE